MKTLLLLSAVFSMTVMIAIDKKSAIKNCFLLGATIEDVALETFVPSHENLDCWQSFKVKAAKVGYTGIPIATTLLPGIIISGVTGDYRGIFASMCMLFPLGYYDWYKHERAGAKVSNALAKSYVPHEYQLHYNTCKTIYEEMQEAADIRIAYALYQQKECMRIERQKQREFEKTYKHQTS